MSVKRKMWRRLSSGPRELPLTDNEEAEGWRLESSPLLMFVRKFAGLLKPRLGSELNLEEAVCGLEIFERPVCSSEMGDATAANSCWRRSFHTCGEITGVAVDISGVGTSEGR